MDSIDSCLEFSLDSFVIIAFENSDLLETPFVWSYCNTSNIYNVDEILSLFHEVNPQCIVLFYCLVRPD